MTTSTTAAVVGCCAAALLGLSACAGSDGDPAQAAQIAVTASDDACTIDDASVPAGAVSVTVTNEGDQLTEVYVYGDGDAIVAEKEDITPGSSVDFTAQLEAGSYQVACKPGQTGDGIRTELTVE